MLGYFVMRRGDGNSPHLVSIQKEGDLLLINKHKHLCTLFLICSVLYRFCIIFKVQDPMI